MKIKNFGHNVVYEPRHIYTPATESEVLDILAEHKSGHIRVGSSGHSWSDIVSADDAYVRLSKFTDITVEERDGGPVARIGAGATLQYILDTLHRTTAYTLPTMGGVKRQTIAGATATATHGTGKASLSSYIQGVKLACFDSSGKPVIKTITEGDELLAVRASLGCMGVILEITIEIVPKFWMQETAKAHPSIESILKEEEAWPQQQFFVFPHGWRWYAYHRKAVPEPDTKTKRKMRWLKWYDVLVVELGLHSMVKMADGLARIFGKNVITTFWKYILPPFMRPGTFVGDSETVLTLHTEHHYTFRHVEMELFFPKEHILAAATLVQEVIPYLAGTSDRVRPEIEAQLKTAGTLDELKRLHGTYVHHYPLFFRHILPEETLIAMNEGAERYSMSVFTFTPPRKQQAYYDACAFLARTCLHLYGARPHWGKYNPLKYTELQPLYPQIARFHEICAAHDPEGVFQNEYTRQVVGFN